MYGLRHLKGLKDILRSDFELDMLVGQEVAFLQYTDKDLMLDKKFIQRFKDVLKPSKQ